MTEPSLVVALLTCHNRRALTLRCLEGFFGQDVDDVRLGCVVCDDGSTDGTADAIAATHPDGVEIVSGDGELYWAAGMALAERRAVRLSPDFLLWLNDDTTLDHDALARLLALSRSAPGAVIVGATRDPATGDITYGGRRRASRWHVQRLERLPMDALPQRADTFNGNVVLVPRAVREAVGPIDDRWPHAYADDDYGYRVREHGIDILQAPGTVATCAPNLPPPHGLRGVRAWRYDQHPKRSPWRAQVRFWRRHAGPGWPVMMAVQEIGRLLGRASGARR